MQKRLLSMLVIGGVAVLCFAPEDVRAEDRTQIQWEGNAVSNINTDKTLPTPLPTNPERQRPTALATAVDPSNERYRSLIESISAQNGVDPNLIDAMIRTESNYNPWAVSPKGARGLMQLIPETGYRFGVMNFFDPQQNIEGGVRYMKYLLEMFNGNVDLSLAAYNAGENLVARLGKIPPYPETRNYVRKIRAVYSNPATAKIESSLKSDLSSPPATVPPSKNETAGKSSLPEKLKEAPVLAISNWVDERGIRHFSNIEPLK